MGIVVAGSAIFGAQFEGRGVRVLAADDPAAGAGLEVPHCSTPLTHYNASSVRKRFFVYRNSFIVHSMPILPLTLRLLLRCIFIGDI